MSTELTIETLQSVTILMEHLQQLNKDHGIEVAGQVYIDGTYTCDVTWTATINSDHKIEVIFP